MFLIGLALLVMVAPVVYVLAARHCVWAACRVISASAGQQFTCVIALGTSILLSVVLTVILNRIWCGLTEALVTAD